MPIRTCVGCRRRAEASELLRVAWTPDGLVVDRLAPGRGAWLHPGCGHLAARRRAFGRALRRDVGGADAVAAIVAAVDGPRLGKTAPHPLD